MEYPYGVVAEKSTLKSKPKLIIFTDILPAKVYFDNMKDEQVEEITVQVGQNLYTSHGEPVESCNYAESNVELPEHNHGETDAELPEHNHAESDANPPEQNHNESNAEPPEQDHVESGAELVKHDEVESDTEPVEHNYVESNAVQMEHNYAEDIKRLSKHIRKILSVSKRALKNLWVVGLPLENIAKPSASSAGKRKPLQCPSTGNFSLPLVIPPELMANLPNMDKWLKGQAVGQATAEASGSFGGLPLADKLLGWNIELRRRITGKGFDVYFHQENAGVTLRSTTAVSNFILYNQLPAETVLNKRKHPDNSQGSTSGQKRAKTEAKEEGAAAQETKPMNQEQREDLLKTSWNSLKNKKPF